MNDNNNNTRGGEHITYRDTGVTVNSLFRRSNRNALKIIVDDLVQLIDALILTTHESGGNSISYDLPNTFSLNNMSVKDAQILVYSELIQVYLDKGFSNISIKLGHAGSVLYISWLNGMTKNERERRKGLIMKYMR